MKSVATVIVFTLWAFAATATGATAPDPCRNGQQCTNAQGQASRCNSVGVCMSNLKPCPSSSALLQRCHRTDTYFCFPLFDNSTLQCLDLPDIDPIVARDACTGKPDGTKCIYAYSDMNGPSLDTATVFELPGTCSQSDCLSPIHVNCMDKKLSEPCTYESIRKGNLVRFSGSCQSRGIGLMNRCDLAGAATVIGPAKVLTQSPVTPAPSSTASAPTASRTPGASSGSVASDSDVKNPFDSIDSIWTRTSAPFTFAPYVPETPRPPTSYVSSSSGGSDPTVKIVLGVLGAAFAAAMFIVRQVRQSSPPAEAAPVVVVDHPHTPEVDTAYSKLEAGGGQNVAPQHTTVAAGARSNERP